MFGRFLKIPTLDVAVRGGVRFGTSHENVMNATLGFLDLMAMRVSEVDKRDLLDSIPNARKALARAFDKRMIDGSFSTAIALIQSSGLSVEAAVDFLEMLYDEIDNGASSPGLVDRIKAQLAGQLPPFF